MNVQVTKPKHPGRVAAGKKLEFNHKKKEKLIKNKSQVDLSDEPSANEVDSSTSSSNSSSNSSSTYSSCSTGAVIVAIAGVAVFFLWKLDISPKTSSEPLENDIFRMN